jgi:hypothetical protein
MSDIGNSLRVPIFLAAPTPEELVRLMLENNLKFQKEHRYFDITFEGSKWIAWFYSIIEIKAQAKKTIKTKGNKNGI